MKSNRKKAHCYLVSNEGRDFYLLIGVIYYLERYVNFDVQFEFVWDAHKIKREQPDLVILPNTRGSQLYFEIGKYCHENNILVYANESEGNFNTTIAFDYWAYNKDLKSFCPIVYSWNERVAEFLEASANVPKDQLRITGAAGVDKYRFSKKSDRNQLLAKYGKERFQSVVGYAGWAFGKIENKELDDVLSNIGMSGETGKKWMIEKRDWTEEALRKSIEAFPDTLFIFKKHPRENFESDYRDSRNEMNRIAHYENVLYLKDQEDIQDLIQISDIWMAFESTSIMEAWLFDVPTLIINPVKNFSRVGMFVGSLQIHKHEDLLAVLNDVLVEKNWGKINAPEIVKQRLKTLKDAFGFVDGLNHIRCALAFLPFIKEQERTTKKIRLNKRFLRFYLLLHIGKYFYWPALFKRTPKLKKTVWIFENYRLTKVNALKKVVFDELDSFYAVHDIDKKLEQTDFVEKLMKTEQLFLHQDKSIEI